MAVARQQLENVGAKIEQLAAAVPLQWLDSKKETNPRLGFSEAAPLDPAGAAFELGPIELSYRAAGTCTQYILSLWKAILSRKNYHTHRGNVLKYW